MATMPFSNNTKDAQEHQCYER